MVLTQLLVAGLFAAISAKFIYPNNIEEADRVHWTGFNSFVKQYNRQYSSDEEMFKRFQIYKDNLQLAKEMQKSEKGTATYGETKFSDMTPEEFKQMMHAHILPEQTNRRPIDIEKFGVTGHIPKSIDWRKKGAVTKVGLQGHCGSCWTFSVVGNIEGAWAIAKGKLVKLSEQQLLDCDTVNFGCIGGFPLWAYREIVKHMGGLEKEEDYPYNATQRKCTIDKSKFVAYINDSVMLPSDEVKMAVWVARRGPISVGFNMSPLPYYQGGVIEQLAIGCPAGEVDHAVLIVGYGSEMGVPYWIVKNSWGADWGEEGYFRLYRGENICGINSMPSSAIIY